MRGEARFSAETGPGPLDSGPEQDVSGESGEGPGEEWTLSVVPALVRSEFGVGRRTVVRFVNHGQVSASHGHEWRFVFHVVQ